MEGREHCPSHLGMVYESLPQFKVYISLCSGYCACAEYNGVAKAVCVRINCVWVSLSFVVFTHTWDQVVPI